MNNFMIWMVQNCEMWISIKVWRLALGVVENCLLSRILN